MKMNSPFMFYISRSMTVRTVLITGSTRYSFQSIINNGQLFFFFYSSGIGLGIARSFAKAKYNIIFNGLEKNGNEIAANTAKEFQVDYMFSPANALHSDQLRSMVDEGLSRFKHIGESLFSSRHS